MEKEVYGLEEVKKESEEESLLDLAPPFKKYVIIQGMGFFVLFLILFMDDMLSLFGSKLPMFDENRLIIKIVAFLFIFICNLYVFHKTISQIKLLQGLLQICSSCKRIKVRGEWIPVEEYIEKQSHAVFSHGICPECARKLYGEEYTKDL